VSLSVTPARITLTGRGQQSIVLHNDGTTRLRVLARATSFTLDLYGNAAISPRRDPARSARTWLNVRPRRLVLGPGRKGVLRIDARPVHNARPGDHHALILLSALPPRQVRTAVRTRVGVLVFVRIRGQVRRRIVVGRIWLRQRARRRILLVSVANRGNVTERLERGQMTIAFFRGEHLVARARAQSRDLLVGARALLAIPLQRFLRGRYTAVVRIDSRPGWTAGPSAPPLPSAEEAFSLRL